MKTKISIYCTAFYALSTVLSACKSSSTEDKINTVTTENKDELYFSSGQFITDQWNTNKTQPYVVLRVINEDGKSDSTYINQDENLFKEFSKYFIAADIAKSNLLDKYEYSENFDASSGFAFLTYIAKDAKLFTQKLEISIDPYNSKIKAVYIETNDDGWFNSTNQKILYTVEKGAFIQEYTKTIFSSLKERKMAYLYKY